MNTVKRFVCYVAGINIALVALLLAFAWVSPDDAPVAGEARIIPATHVIEQPASAPLTRT